MSPTPPSTPHLPRLVVVDPTTTGKSALTLDLAKRMHSDESAVHAEIIGADASLPYHGMDIGTARPSPTERARVPHHQADVLTIRDRTSVAALQRSVRGDVDAVESQGHLPIIAGGSGLYVRALADDLDSPNTNPTMRNRLSERAEQEGAAVLRVELVHLDSAATERAGASNIRRIVWAPEVIEITGRPFSTSLPCYEDVAPTVHIALRCEHRFPDKHISERAYAIFDGGLIEEVEALISQGILEGETVPRATSYVQAFAITDGTMSTPEAVDSIALVTRRLASRQIKQFRRDPWLHRIDVALAEAGQCTNSERSRLTWQVRELACVRHGTTQARDHATLDRSSRS